MNKKVISLVVPVYYEEDCIKKFIEETIQVLETIQYDYELIFIDDGSTDNTVVLIEAAIAKNSKIKLIKFSYNHGKPAAVSAGIHHAVGDYIVHMDPDLQDPPYEIPNLLSEIEKGYNVVYGLRRQKIDGFLNILFSKIFWWVLNRFTKLNIPPRLAVMRIFDRHFANQFNKYNEQNRFTEGIFFRIGMRYAYLEVDQNERYAGKSKFNFKRKMDLAMTAILDFSELPLRSMTRFGLFLSFAGCLSLLFIFVAKVFFIDFQTGWPSIISVLTLAFGVQMSFMGIIALYIGRIYKEVKNRPIYSIKEKIGFNDQ